MQVGWRAGRVGDGGGKGMLARQPYPGNDTESRKEECASRHGHLCYRLALSGHQISENIFYYMK